jgi:hypothetical protein
MNVLGQGGWFSTQGIHANTFCAFNSSVIGDEHHHRRFIKIIVYRRRHVQWRFVP